MNGENHGGVGYIKEQPLLWINVLNLLVFSAPCPKMFFMILGLFSKTNNYNNISSDHSFATHSSNENICTKSNKFGGQFIVSIVFFIH